MLSGASTQRVTVQARGSAGTEGTGDQATRTRIKFARIHEEVRMRVHLQGLHPRGSAGRTPLMYRYLACTPVDESGTDGYLAQAYRVAQQWNLGVYR